MIKNRKAWEPWTIVHPGTLDPIVPVDCNEHEDQGLLVYRSKEAAQVAARHQKDTYDVKCRPVPLSSVILHERSAPLKTPQKQIGLKFKGRNLISKSIGVTA